LNKKEYKNKKNIKMKRIVLFTGIILIAINCVFSQGYTNYLTGSSDDVTSSTEFGICLMGGGGEDDLAMARLLEASGGGDVIVLRATGSDGYNDYMYSELGVTVNSVETLVVYSSEGANNSYVVQQVNNAEVIWIAGGDQYDYVSFWKDTYLEDAINAHVSAGKPIGGTSAGMVVLGAYYYSAQYGSVTSYDALMDPYNIDMTFGDGDFLQVPGLLNVITDTHYDERDRRGRHFAFLARYITDKAERPYGIACNEGTAVYIDENNIATCYGIYSDHYTYFLQTKSGNPYEPEVCEPGSTLTWNREQQAVLVYKLLGSQDGTRTFDLNDWSTGNGGSWEYWFSVNGTHYSQAASIGIEDHDNYEIQHKIYPNPSSKSINVQFSEHIDAILEIYSVIGQKLFETQISGRSIEIDISNLPSSVYFLKSNIEGYTHTKQFIKQ
jgi:cyanophycinase-like exopeptidase